MLPKRDILQRILSFGGRSEIEWPGRDNENYLTSGSIIHRM